MFKTKNLPLTISAIVLISLMVGWGIDLAIAVWSGPTADPPVSDVFPPINVSVIEQWKDGRLGVGTATEGIYWLKDVGDSLYFQNKDDQTKMTIGYDGKVGIGTMEIGPTGTADELGVYDSGNNLILIFDEGI